MEDNKRMVSIIMPVYNSEKFVSEAIESVLNQSYKNWELLIVNDGSTDQSPKIINDYAEKDSRIKVFHRNNQGVSMARNFALDRICGEYVTFIDSDDVYLINRLERLLQVFAQYKDCDIVFSRHKEFKGKLNINEVIDSGKVEFSTDNILKRVISNSNNHFMWNVMLKTEIAKKKNLHRYVLQRIFVISGIAHGIAGKWRFWMKYCIFTDVTMRMP